MRGTVASYSQFFGLVLGLQACGGDAGPQPAAGGTGSLTPPAQTAGATAAAGGASGAAAGGGAGAMAGPAGSGATNAGAPAAGGGAAAAAGSGGGATAMAGAGAGAAGMGSELPTAETCDKPLMPMAGEDPCTAPLTPGADRLCEFMYEGQSRRFMVYAPMSFNPCKPAAMILDSHGAMESIEVHVGTEGFDAESPTGYGSHFRRAVQGDNAIVVTPEGVSLFWNQADDPAFLNEVANMVEKMATVDPEKRYLTGISMGGMITAETGCGDATRWRGMAPVAMLTNTCPSLARPTPTIIFHAPTDSITSYEDSEAFANSVAMLNNCKMSTPGALHLGGAMSAPDAVCFNPPPTRGGPDNPDPYTIPYEMCPTSRPETVCDHWTQCDEGVEVMFCSVAAETQVYGGHLLYVNDTGLSLGEMAWPFFKKFWK